MVGGGGWWWVVVVVAHGLPSGPRIMPFFFAGAGMCDAAAACFVALDGCSSSACSGAPSVIAAYGEL